MEMKFYDLPGRGLWLLLLAVFFAAGLHAQSISFDQKTLQNANISGGTSLEFGPDGRLYVTEVDGDVKIYTIELDNNGDYVVTDTENITFIKSIPNHDDDDGEPGGPNNRQVTGIAVGGTVSNPVFYVSSSDSRVGAGGGGGDVNLDTNSGVITRASWNGSSWDVVDIVRGLPRSEENHATNDMDLVTGLNGNDYLIVCSGGFTNAGAPSNNFAYITEYALAGAVLSVNLTMLESMPILTDPSSGRQYIYDLPTLDDPTRGNLDINGNPNGPEDPDDPGYTGIDENDPWGGNDGLNMAMLVPGSPVEMFSPGYRNTYDLVITESGAVYVTDNGANGGWGGYPENEATANVNNIFRQGEPGSGGFDNANNEPQVNNSDHLNLVTTDISSYTFGSVYGGHPCPVRANVNAGLYTRGTHSDANGGLFFSDDVFRTQIYDPDGSTPGSTTDPELGLPANWPPVHPSLINPADADFRQPTLSGNGNPDGPEDIIIVNWGNNTNAIDEYTASNFGGQMQGNLIAGKSGGGIHRVVLDSDNGAADLSASDLENWANVGGNPLGIVCQGDNDIFPGTIWFATFNNVIKILEPADFVVCIQPGETGYDPNGDNDFDGYTNQDEIDNGTDICSGASVPNDLDGDFVSDLNDLDDDGDGINDENDEFQLGEPFDLPVDNELFSDELGFGVGFRGMGLTGLMNNFDPNPNYLNWLDDPGASSTDVDDIYGGAIGAMTIYHTTGDALGANNNQEKAFQFGVNVSTATGEFTVSGRMFPPFHNWSPTESQGLFIGTGDQDNYVKAVLTQNVSSGNTVVQIVTEDGGSPANGDFATINIPVNVNDIDLFFNIDPADGSIQVQYSVDGGAKVNVGSVTPPPAVLNAIQSSNTPLAVGVIGRADSDDNFASNWDFLRVLGSAPFVEQPLPDIDRLVGDPDDNINLDDYFGDDNGDGNLSYTASSDNGDIGASLSGSTLTLTYPAATAANATITVTATDGDNLTVQQTFAVTVLDEPVPVLRVNAGGAGFNASDGGPDWLTNTGNGAQSGTDPQSGYQYNNNTGQASTHNIPASGRHSSIPDYITDAEFENIFQNERWDQPSGPEMEWTFDVPDGNYEVRLYMGNGCGCTSAPGDRVFDVSIEGQLVIDDLDLTQKYGHQVGAMEAYQTSVTDGTLNILFEHVVENPLINGIEILQIGGQLPDPPLTIQPIPNQTNSVGDMPDPATDVVASGGDPLENFSYSATGLPPGIQLEPTNGDMFGTVGPAAEGNVYNVTITVDKPSSDPVSTSFTWTILGPVTPGDIVYRVNAGGPVTGDAEVDWEEDQATSMANGSANPGTPSPYVNIAAEDLTFGADPAGFTNNTGYPDAIFKTERYNTLTPPDNMQWDFPVDNGTYIVNLLFAEIWTGAQNTGVRVFDVEVEGQLVLDDFDQVVAYNWNTAGVETFNVTVTDGNLDIDFIQGVQNPAIKGIEILAAGAAPGTDAEALITVHEGSNNINASTFGGNSFEISNNSGSGQQINSVTIDLSTTLLPEIVFDPNGTAGDMTAKGFTLDDAGATGSVTSSLSQSFGNGGFRQLDITFSDFDPTESMSFSIDVDPTSIAGLGAPGPNESGSVSGLELAGATVTVVFDDGSTLTNQIYSDGSQGGGVATVKGELPTAPTIIMTGLSSPTTTNTAAQTVEISGGPPNGTVSLLQLEAGFFENGGNLGQQPFEVNSVIDVNRQTAIQLDGTGAATVNVTLADSDPEAGYNYFLAAIEDGSAFGNVSNPLIIEYDQNLTNTPPAITPLADVTVTEGETATASITASDNESDPLSISIQLTDNSDNSVVDPVDYSFTDFGDGTAEFSWLTTVGDAGSYQATVTVSDGVNAPVTETFLVIVNPDVNTQPAVYINAGGPEYTDGQGRVFVADQNFTTPSSTFSTTEAIANTDDDPLFQTERYGGDFSYNIPVQNGTYTVDIYLAEIFVGNPGAPGSGPGLGTGDRIFSVDIEGTTVISEIDLFDTYGAITAAIESFPDIEVTDGSMDIQFYLGPNGVDNAKVSALCVVPATSSTNNPPVVVNPGNQSDAEGETINLPVSAQDDEDCGSLTYSATGLPPSLTIDPATGVISGTLDEPTPGTTGGAFIEQNGLVVIEMESADNLPGSWETASTYSTSFSPNVNNPGGATGGDFIVWQAGQNLGNPGVGQIAYQVQINNPGTYQFKWRSQVGNGTSSTEHNDTWLKIEADAFYGQQGGGSIVCPKGFDSNTNDCMGGAPEGSGADGWFKIYSSGSTNWTWSTNTSDNDAHQIYARFDNPGTYNILISARSNSHVIDRMVLVGSTYNGNEQDLSLPESPRAANDPGSPGAAANSPYDVEVTVTDNCDPALATTVNFQWEVTQPVGNPAALVTVNSGAGLTASTFGNNSFQIQNTGDVDIVSVSIDASSAFLPDVVFDPVGTAGDNGAKCLTQGSASVGDVGITVPANGGSDAADCESVFQQPHNGVDNDEGYDIIALDFTDFNSGEIFAFGVDMDPTSIKGDLSTGDAGAISGFELIGAMVTIEFANGQTIVTSLWDESSLGGSQAVVATNTPAPAPSIAVDGVAAPATVSNANQDILITGNPNASVTLLRVDGRLYIDPGNPGLGYDVDPFEANEAMAKQLYTVTLDNNGQATVPVTLTQTTSPDVGPDGGLNHFVAVENGPNGQTSKASNVIVLEYDPNATGGTPGALVEITPGGGLGASTFGGSSFQVTNTGDVNITSVSIDLSTGILPDMVFDPVGAGGDATSSCFTPNSGGSATGVVIPNDPCVDPFTVPRNGGFDVITVDFTDFNGGEQFFFTTDIDPNSIQGVSGAGNAGAVSGYELIGSTVTVTFSDGSVVTTNLYDDGSLGGSQAIAVVDPTLPAAPTIAAQGVAANPAAVPSLNQTITVTGTPGANVSLLQMDTRLYIASGDPPFDVDASELPFYANEAMSGKVLHTAVIEGDGDVDIPVTLLQTPGPSGTPDGGVNRFIAVLGNQPYAVDQAVSQTSNVVVLKYDPNAQDAGLTITLTLQGRADYSGDYTVDFYDPNDTSTPVYTFTPTANEFGEMTVTGIVPGTYAVAVKHPKYLQAVETVTLVSGSNAIDMGQLAGGDANDDNLVTAQDFSILAFSFNKASGDSGYDDRADFNGDDFVSAQDFSILATNFNTSGETPLTSGLNVEVREEPIFNKADLHVRWTTENARVGDEIVADLILDAGAQRVDAVEAHLRYNAEQLEVAGIEWTNALDLTLREDVDPAAGTIDLAAGSLTRYTSGEQVVATIRFRTKTEGLTEVRFNETGPPSLVTFQGRDITEALKGDQLSIGDPAAVMSLRVFPNPAKDRINLFVDHPADPDQIEVRVFNLDGRLMLRRPWTQPTLQLQQLAAGVYVLEVISGNEVQRTRFVIE